MKIRTEQREQIVVAPRTERSLELRLFGPFELRIAGIPLPPLRSRQGQWLLALLVLNRSRPVAREWLATTLWPDSAPEQALYNLRRNLTDLRHVLGDAASRLLAPTSRILALDLQGADCDLVRFEEAIRSDDPIEWERAITLYRGPLLEACTEEWVLTDRQRCEQAYLAALEDLARCCPDSDPSVAYLRRVIAADPTRESAQRALMSALAARGEYAAATQVYRELRLRLHEELGVAPDKETTAHYRRLRAEARQRTQVQTPATAGSPSLPAGSSAGPGAAPTPLTSLIGRQHEIAAVAALLDADRLVTLLGPGGIGKTRLALAVLESAEETFSEGAVFVDLSAIDDGVLVPSAVAAALGIREESGARPLLQTMAGALRSRSQLIVLDNCEQVLPACTRLAETLLRATAGIRLLATSRQALGIAGERTYSVPGLEPPPARKALSPPQLLRFDAVRLFVDRARAIAPRFAIDDTNAEAVREICHSLEGVPLAIELAAARVRTLAPEEIARHLGERFRLLTGGSRTAPPRQQTLRALIDWSYDLLSPAERRTLAGVSVFAGGWYQEQAEAICTVDTTVERWEMLDLLTSLAEKSLLVAQEDERGENRYRLLETVRQYAREKRAAYGDDDALQDRHADWFLAFVLEARPRLRSAEQGMLLARLEIEQDNLNAAIDRLLTGTDPAPALRMTWGLEPFWVSRGQLSDARRRYAAALALTAEAQPPAARADTLHAAGNVAYHQADYTAAEGFYQTEQALREQLGDRRGLAGVLGSLGNLAQYRGDAETAQRLFRESMAINRETGNQIWLSANLTCLGNLASESGDARQGIVYLEEALAITREIGDRRGELINLLNLGSAVAMAGDEERGTALAEEALALCDVLGEQYHRLTILCNLADDFVLRHDWPEAWKRYRAVLTLAREQGALRPTISALEGISNILRGEGRPERAVRYYAVAAALRETANLPLPPNLRDRRAGEIAEVRAALGEAAFAAGWQSGRALTEAQAAAELLGEALNAPH